MKLALDKVAELMSATGDFDRAAVAEGYSIDSRGIAPGSLFFAVKGERLDGHDFVNAALGAGAVGAVVRRDWAARLPGTRHGESEDRRAETLAQDPATQI